MNKPYFTKYLKPDKELSWYLKDGEMIEREWYGPTGGFNREIVPYKTGMQSLSEKRVKLFLCSRDIQVGDTVYNKYYTDYANGKVINTNSEKMDAGMLSGGEPDSSTDYKYPEGEWEYYHQTYKIIGEVSPNAIWVKEGMEFDDNDCLVDTFDDIFTIDGWLQHLIYIEKVGNLTIRPIRFKCPTCNTFH